MFTGIIESTSKLSAIVSEGSNIHFTFHKPEGWNLGVDESVAHNGVCLTVVSLIDGYYTVTAVDETLKVTNLQYLQVGQMVNLERAMVLGSRLDGHIVQGHVDSLAEVTSLTKLEGSWLIQFQYDKKFAHLLVEKGSICINGVSLTCFALEGNDRFSVTIIPYTWEHTHFQNTVVGDKVNIEYDILGKYVARAAQVQLLKE